MNKRVSFLNHFKNVEDVRIPGMITYPLDEILFLVLSGMLCGFEEIEEMIMWGNENLDWLRRFLKYEHKLPTAKTLRKVLSHLDPKSLQSGFEDWAASISENLSGVVAIDGKTVRGSKKDQDGRDALHIVNAFAHEMGLVLGQENCR